MGLVRFIPRTECPVRQPAHLEVITNWLFDSVNHYRVSVGKPRLELDSTLCEFASLRAGQIVNNFSHAGFAGNPYRQYYYEMGEALARDYQDREVIVESWVASPLHEEILAGNYNVGCVAYRLVDDRLFVALEVAR